MIEPLELSFDIACSIEHAFDVWTARIGMWWPADHTITGEPGLDVVLEPSVGGRIYERTQRGTEHDWGEVTVWEPPTRLSYLWHLRRARSQATEVELRFVALDSSSTRVQIEHRGWERLGAGGEDWRDRNHGGWQTLLPRYIAAINTNPVPQGGGV
jgi:hypothetical protein